MFDGMNEWMNKYEWDFTKTPVRYTLPQTPIELLIKKGNPFDFCKHGPIPRDRTWNKSLNLFKECHPVDIFVVMWKKGLENVLSRGMAGMRNGNYFAFYTDFGKGNKKKKNPTASVLVNILCLSWKVL